MMLRIKNENVAIPVVLFAGILWSFGPLVVRHIDQPELVPWQYLMARGITIFILLNIYLFFEEGLDFYKNYSKMGKSGLIGGTGLGIAMMSFIWSITHTSAAITLLCLAAMPFMTALLGFFFLKEIISRNVWIAIIVATIGIIIMSLGDYEKGSLFGFLFGILSAFGFSIFSVSLRWRKDTPKFTTVAIAGIFCASLAIILLLINGDNVLISLKDSSLSALHGFLVCTGLILFSAKSKYLPATDLTLLCMTEVIGGIFWVWLPLFGINEIPSLNTLIGGSIILSAIIFYAFNARRFMYKYGK